MTTFAVPFFDKEDEFAGVVTVDLILRDYVTMLREREKELKLGKGVYGFLIDQKGRIIGHPEHPIVELEDHEFETLSAHASLEILQQQITKGGAGKVEIDDPWYDDMPSTFIFSRVRSTGWNFVLVFPEKTRTPGTSRGKWKVKDTPIGGD